MIALGLFILASSRSGHIAAVEIDSSPEKGYHMHNGRILLDAVRLSVCQYYTGQYPNNCINTIFHNHDALVLMATPKAVMSDLGPKNYCGFELFLFIVNVGNHGLQFKYTYMYMNGN